MISLIQNINSKVRITPTIESRLSALFQREEIPKGNQIIKTNRITNKLYFIESGIFRSFYDHQFKDVTSWFYLENQWMTAWYSFYAESASFENIEALENAVVYSIDRDKLSILNSEHFQFESFMRLMAEEQVAFMDMYFKGYMFMSATEKHNLLISTYPQIENKVKLGYIASYLGISQETLSRIRKQKSS